MKRVYFLLVILSIVLPGKLFADGSVNINLRPSHLDITSDTAQSAVLVTLSGYSKDLVRYRLYNGSNQYNCWDAVTEKYISSTSYGNGPLALGTPSSSSTFWIPFQRGSNNNTAASYRDRVDPYSANNNTLAFPAATEITSSFLLSGNLVAAGSFVLNTKYIVLGFNGTTLVTATSSYLTTGKFSLICPVGTTIDKVEIRTLTNTIITSKTGIYNATANLGNIDLIMALDNLAPVFQADYPKMTNIKATQADLEVKMDEAGKVFFIVVPDGSATPSAGQVFAGADYGTVKLITGGTIDAMSALSVVSRTITGLTDKTNYDIYVVAQDDEAAPNKQTAPVKVDLYTINPPDVLKSVDFTTALAPFTQVSITGDQLWNKAEYSGNSYAYINGYSGGNKENNDWLISPALNLDTATSVKVSFKTAKNYTGPALKVMISSNFNGTFTPAGVNGATWTDITSNFEYSGGSFAWKASGEFALSAYSGKVYIAFVYESTTEAAAAWEVDDFLLTGYLKNTGIDQLEENEISVYPVPAKDVIHFGNLKGVNALDVFDLQGRMLLQKMVNGLSNVTLNVNGLPNGVYMVRFHTSGVPVVKRFIKNGM
ncbi:MAG TPA: choice-of-anchor J domain-containing protein [Prolixibacteraceae bacterium]|nr:choice-of-anchor J domain-containing protein [Prolixibacteraceae bacterium]